MCTKYGDSYRFLSIGFDGLVKTLDNNGLMILKKKQFPDKWEYLNKSSAHSFEYF